MRRLTAIMLALAIMPVGVAVTSAASAEHVCITAAQASYAGETIACYSEAGCAHAQKMGGDAVRDYDVASAPFALARGKIAAIVTSSEQLIKNVTKAGGNCAPVVR